MLEAKREDRDLHELLVGELRERAAQAGTQGLCAQLTGVYDQVGGVAHRRKLGALAGDGAGEGLAGLGQRVAAAVLVVAAHEDLVGGVQKDHLAGELVLAQLREGLRDLVEEALAAQVARDGQVAAHARVDAHELGQLEYEARRQVVYAEVAHVLEDVERLRAAATAHAGDHDDVRNAVAALRHAHALAIPHVGLPCPGFLRLSIQARRARFGKVRPRALALLAKVTLRKELLPRRAKAGAWVTEARPAASSDGSPRPDESAAFV